MYQERFKDDPRGVWVEISEGKALDRIGAYYSNPSELLELMRQGQIISTPWAHFRYVTPGAAVAGHVWST